MSTELRIETIPASGQIILAPGNFFFLLSATSAVSVTFIRRGTKYGATGVQAGYVKGMVDQWERAVIAGSPGAIVQFFLGDEDIGEDITDIRTQIATIAGIVPITEQPSSAIATPARTTRATGGASTIAQNLLRKRITISNPSDNATPGLLYVQAVGAGAGRGYPLDPGMSVELKTTAAIDVRNDSGASVDFTTLEET